MAFYSRSHRWCQLLTQTFAQCTLIELCFELSFESSFVAYFSSKRVSQITCLHVVNCSAKRSNFQSGVGMSAITLDTQVGSFYLIFRDKKSRVRWAVFLNSFYALVFSYLQIKGFVLYITS